MTFPRCGTGCEDLPSLGPAGTVRLRRPNARLSQVRGGGLYSQPLLNGRSIPRRSLSWPTSRAPSRRSTPETACCAGPARRTSIPRSSRPCSCRCNGHLDPDFWDLLLDLVEGLKALWRRPDGLSLCFSASGTSGMEAGLANLVEPGDTVLVIHSGFFGARIAEMARRAGADLVELTAPLGQIVPLDQVADALAKHPDTKLVGVVHAETSTGVRYPVEELGAGDRRQRRRRRAPAGRLRDVARRRGGLPRRVGHRLRATPARRSRSAVPRGSRRSASRRARWSGSRDRKAPVSFSFDIELLRKYWIERPITYHHTMPILQYYALYEGIRLALEEGLEARWAPARGRRPVLPAADARARLHVPVRPRAPALGAVGDRRARRRRRQGRPDPDPAGVRHRGGRRARADRAARSGALD